MYQLRRGLCRIIPKFRRHNGDQPTRFQLERHHGRPLRAKETEGVCTARPALNEPNLPGAFFSHPALIALVVALFVMAGAALFVGGNISPGVREDRGNRWVIAALSLIGLLAASLPAWTVLDTRRRRHPLARRRPLRGRRRAAVVARRRARKPVQRAGCHPARAHTGHQRRLWSHSPPKLFGLLVNSLGCVLAFRTGVCLLLTALLIPPLLARIRAEERLLRAQFGAEYEAYRARTSWANSGPLLGALGSLTKTRL
jgi:hypothetical protein